jgi:hypothetical protein
VIAELAAACRDHVKRAVGVALDGTPETLPLLDHYVTISRPSISQRPEVLDLLVRTTGAYFGELVRTKLGGFWWPCDEDPSTWLVCCRSVFLAINPFGVALEALCQRVDVDGPSAQVRVAPDCRQSAQARLSRLPSVSEEEYYLLSTRLEALEIVAEASRAVRLAERAEPRDFDQDDYEHELG